MKKRTALLLALVLAFALLSPLAQAADLYFVAVNDTVPLTLSADSAPFYSGGDLYASRAVFSVSGLGITPSYNETGKTLTLFARSSRIVFYLDENRTVDETGAELALTTIRKNGVIYVPVAACAEHFGRSVSYLTSSDGYRVLRFTSGSQVYDDSLFMEKAANLIAYRASQYQSEQSSAATNPPNGQQQTEQNDQTQHDPATVYIAVTGAETMERTLLLLSARGIPAVFFFTEAEIKANAELVLAIRAAGYPIGLTASPNEEDLQVSLDRANDALDDLLCYKTLFALLSRAQIAEVSGYFTLSRSYASAASNAAKMDGGKALVLLTGDAYNSLNTLRDAKVRFRQLRETTY